MAEEGLAFAFHDNTIFVFVRACALTASRFGGPMPSDVTGIAHGPRPLHMIAELGSLHVPALGKHYLFGLPLVYGMHYDGGELTYRVHRSHQIEVLRLVPAQSSDDCPYENFPPLLPFVPMRLADTPQRQSYDDFAQLFPNMPERQRADLVVAVPPLATLGLSLWGRVTGRE